MLARLKPGVGFGRASCCEPYAPIDPPLTLWLRAKRQVGKPCWVYIRTAVGDGLFFNPIFVLASMSSIIFTPKNAVVTGAAQGIGRAIALRLAEDGLNVVLNDLPKNQQALDDLAKEITSKGVTEAVVYAGSVSEKSINEGIVAACVENFGSLDVVRAPSQRIILYSLRDRWSAMRVFAAR